MSRYTSDVAELAVPAESAEALPAFAAELEALPWVSGVTIEENHVRVAAADVAAGQLALLPLVVKHNLPLLRYEWMRPNLEEIFLSLSEEARQ